MSEIFRKNSIKNYYDPEHLNRAVKIASSFSWLGILAAAVLIVAVLFWSFFGNIPKIVSVKAVFCDKENVLAVHTTVSGSLRNYNVGEGDKVKKGQTVAIVKHLDKDVLIKSPFDGTVGEMLYQKNEIIYAYDEILWLTPDVEGENVVVSYIPVTQSDKIKSGMETKLSINDDQVCFEGEVLAVGDYPASDKNMRYVIGRDNALKKSLTNEHVVVAVVYRIKNKQARGSYILSDNRKISVKKGSIVKAKILTEDRPPISLLFGFLTSGEAKSE